MTFSDPQSRSPIASLSVGNYCLYIFTTADKNSTDIAKQDTQNSYTIVRPQKVSNCYSISH